MDTLETIERHLHISDKYGELCMKAPKGVDDAYWKLAVHHLKEAASLLETALKNHYEEKK